MDWFLCNACLRPFTNGISFQMTNCGHIFCNDCCSKSMVRGANDKLQMICSECKAPCSTVEISPQMATCRQYFVAPKDHLQQAVKIEDFRVAQRELALRKSFRALQQARGGSRPAQPMEPQPPSQHAHALHQGPPGPHQGIMPGPGGAAGGGQRAMQPQQRPMMQQPPGMAPREAEADHSGRPMMPSSRGGYVDHAGARGPPAMPAEHSPVLRRVGLGPPSTLGPLSTAPLREMTNNNTTPRREGAGHGQGAGPAQGAESPSTPCMLPLSRQQPATPRISIRSSPVDGSVQRAPLGTPPGRSPTQIVSPLKRQALAAMRDPGGGREWVGTNGDREAEASRDRDMMRRESLIPFPSPHNTFMAATPQREAMPLSSAARGGPGQAPGHPSGKKIIIMTPAQHPAGTR